MAVAGVGFLPTFVGVSVLFFRAWYLKNRCIYKITKLDIQMFHEESWKPIYFDIERSKVKVTSHKSNAGVGVCTPVSAGFF